MKKRKHLLAFSLVTAMLLSLAACGGGSGSNKGNLPTLAPTYTPTPIPDSKGAPTPTPALDANYTKIIELNGEDYNQTSHFAVRGTGSLSVKPVAHTGSFSFYVTGRDNPVDGFSLNFSDKDGAVANVIGKNTHAAAWVYHECDTPQDFALVLQVKKPDLAGRDVNVVWAGKVAILGRAEEAVAIRQNLQGTAGKDDTAMLGMGLQDDKDQLLLFHQ